MKKLSFILLVATFIVLCSCSTIEPDVKNPITVSFPTPTVQLTKVSLSDTQQEYVEQGNGMAFRLLNQMYKGDNLVLSPLSLQYALAMTANGASGETLREITNFLGYGADGIDALNVYCKTMLEQLPAVDLDVTLKLADALLVNDRLTLQNGFRETVQDNYYAAVENMDFSDPDQVAATINDWTRRNTNNFIDRIIEPREIQSNAVAFIMNSLYFKAKWAGERFALIDLVEWYPESNLSGAFFEPQVGYKFDNNRPLSLGASFQNGRCKQRTTITDGYSSESSNVKTVRIWRPVAFIRYSITL